MSVCGVDGGGLVPGVGEAFACSLAPHQQRVEIPAVQGEDDVDPNAVSVRATSSPSVTLTTPV